jgi:hypothetical protein
LPPPDLLLALELLDREMLAARGQTMVAQTGLAAAVVVLAARALLAH